MQDNMLDSKLLMKMAGCSFGDEDDRSGAPPCDETTQAILLLFLGLRTDPQENQQMCEIALKASQQLIDKIDKDPKAFENNPNVSDGCLNRASIHHRRADPCGNLNNPKHAAREFKKALALEPRNCKCLADCAMSNCNCCLKDVQHVVKDCQTVIQNIHPDNRCLRHVHAILSSMHLEFPALGTLEEASQLFEKMKLSEQRQIVLYGENEVKLQMMNQCVNDEKQRFEEFQRNPKCRKMADARMTQSQEFRMQQIDALRQDRQAHEPVKRPCMNCKKAPKHGIELQRCSRCKQVSCCSKARSCLCRFSLASFVVLF